MACVAYRRGFWVCDFRDQSGVRRSIQTTYKIADKKHERLAEQQLAAYLSQIDTGKFEAKSDQRNFAQLVESYRAQLDVREVTRVDYDSIIDTHLSVFFGLIKLRAIKPIVVEQFRSWMQTRKTPNGKLLAIRTINKVLTQLSMLLKYAVGHGWMDSNPCDHVKKLKASISARRRALDGNILTAPECERLYAAAGSPRDAVLFRFAVESGCRQGEILGLTWADIDWATGKVYIRQSVRKGKHSEPKTAASFRSIPLRPELLAQLKAWQIACPHPRTVPGEKKARPYLVFPNTAGHYEGSHNLGRRGFHPALRRAGLRRVRFHDLRHTAASLLLAAKVGIKDVQYQLGHASAQITLDTYSHLMPDATSPGADAMQGIFGGSRAVAGTKLEQPPQPLAEGLTHGSSDTPEASRTSLRVVASDGALARN